MWVNIENYEVVYFIKTQHTNNNNAYKLRLNSSWTYEMEIAKNIHEIVLK